MKIQILLLFIFNAVTSFTQEKNDSSVYMESNVLDGVYVEPYVNISNNHRDRFVSNQFFTTTITSTDKEAFQKLFPINDVLVPSIKGEKNIVNGCVLIEPFKLFNGRTFLPNSIRYYLDTNDVNILENQIELELDSDFKVKEEFLRPFYFKKTEVTNAEYRDFVYWVRDSIARRILSYEDEHKWLILPDNYDSIINSSEDAWRNIDLDNYPINWEEELDYGDSNIRLIINELFYSEQEYFYNEKTIDSRRLKYQFEDRTHKATYIYPDTTVWKENFSYSYENMKYLYFWHPAYDNYPVVGVNYYQIQAFLDWKTKRLQKQFNEIGLEFIVEFSLPSASEWEMAQISQFSDDGKISMKRNYQDYLDNNWLTDLRLHKYDAIATEDSTIGRNYYYKNRNNALNTVLGRANKQFSFPYNYIDDESYKRFLFIKSKKEIDYTIYGLNDNVSEWLSENYKENWLSFYLLRQKQLGEYKAKDIQLLKEIELEFNTSNDTTGVLVKGGNWFDDRGMEGRNAKVFVNPYDSYATVGFRYVIRFEEK